jgi:hypothetical protein
MLLFFGQHSTLEDRLILFELEQCLVEEVFQEEKH